MTEPLEPREGEPDATPAPGDGEERATREPAGAPEAATGPAHDEEPTAPAWCTSPAWSCSRCSWSRTSSS